MKRRFSVSMWTENDLHIAQCLELDVASQGGDEQEALDNLREAIELHFEPPGPTLTPRVETIEVEVSAA
jgi:predicted RNase H-like HicB family nuclease